MFVVHIYTIYNQNQQTKGKEKKELCKKIMVVLEILLGRDSGWGLECCPAAVAGRRDGCLIVSESAGDGNSGTIPEVRSTLQSTEVA